MDEAAAWAASGAPHGAVLTTNHQTGGRGRLGRTWTDVPGQSLLASLVLRPNLPADRLGLIPLAAGLAIAEALDTVTGTRGTALVKWPNDVLVDGRKVAGILTEAQHGPEGSMVIVGMGVNVSQTAFPDALANRAGSIRQLVGLDIDREDLLRAILAALATLLNGLATGRAPEVIDRFERRMANRGTLVTVADGSGRETSGIARGVAPDGALRLEVNGREHRMYAGEVTVPEDRRFLALDIGNSTVKAGVWDAGAWTLARWPTTPDTSAETWATRLADLAPDIEAGGMVSVVPAVGATLETAIRQLELATWAGHVRPETASPDAPVVPSPDLDLSTTGSDRFAAVAGAARLAEPGQSVVVVCAGTAVTVESVRATNGRWTWEGGIIAPGPDLLRRSLPDYTAALPLVDWPEDTAPPFGRSTSQAMQAGLVGLFAGGVTQLLTRATEALPGSPLVVATGGWARWLAEHTGVVSRIESTLILEGVRELA